jgi:hypothetical protein
MLEIIVKDKDTEKVIAKKTSSISKRTPFALKRVEKLRGYYCMEKPR